MVVTNPPESIHFTLQKLAEGVFACIHKPGGAAYSNAGILDFGDRTLVLDAFNTLAAGRDLRQTAETLFARPVDYLALTHSHTDHWIGASAFDEQTTMLTTQPTRFACLNSGEELMRTLQDPGALEKMLQEREAQLRIETDPRICADLEKSISQIRYTITESAEYQPRYADRLFHGVVPFQSRRHKAELRSLGRGHSEDDVVLLLPKDGIAFLGDIGFFNCQPYLTLCDLNLYRRQLLYFLDYDYPVLVPGHGPIGGNDDIVLQLWYFDVLEDLVSQVVNSRGSLKEALQIDLPEPFDKWLMGGMHRFEVNVRYMFAYLGGEQTAED